MVYSLYIDGIFMVYSWCIRSKKIIPVQSLNTRSRSDLIT